MPELLKSPEALDAIARSAATLAKAGVMPLEASIESLTGIMNQMGASAEEAETYINVLAAGSKNGAGNIEYLATAFTKCGSAIRNAGLSVQQGTALIEALAKRMPDAAEAGTALRNVLLVMGTTAGNDLNPKIVGLDKAMENLHARIGDTNEMVKLFGKRNYNAAAILADSTEQVKNLTEAVTGTSEAHLQAEVNGKTLDAQLNRLSSSWTTLTAAIGESNGFLTSFISLINQALQGLATFMRNSAETRIGDHATKSNDRIKQLADDRYNYYRNDRDTKGNLRYNDAQARQQAIN
jgi:TP901 family phage tail tape measure protein